MDAVHGLEMVSELIEKDVANLKDGLASNTATSYEDYKFVCGKIRGLIHAQGTILDLVKKLESS